MNAKIADRYAKVLTLARRGATEGERAASRAAQRRMVAKHPELVESLWGQLPTGYRVEIVDLLRASWDRVEGYTVDPIELEVVIGACDYKEIRGAMRILRDEERAGWRNGVYVGTGDLRFYNVVSWGLEQSLRASLAGEGCSEEEIAEVLRAA